MSVLDRSQIAVRSLHGPQEFRECVALQYETWGEDFEECAPASILLATQMVGGIAAGAFDRDGRLLGFVFGIGGLRDGRPTHWSDMLAVRADARGLGIGGLLKAYQREQLLRNGFEVAYWTYDPLEAPNAHFNINKLGALPVEYVPDMYGELAGALHAGLSSDRFIVRWELRDPKVDALMSGKKPERRVTTVAPIVTSETVAGAPQPRELDLPDAEAVWIEIPYDVQTLKRDSLEQAHAWRAVTRRAALYYLEAGREYRVGGFLRDPEARRCFYVVARS